MWRTTILATAAACSVIGGCATQGPQPTTQLTRARTLVEEADKSQAQRYAALDLQRARDELSAAENANAKGNYDAARGYAEAAAVDADVATARATAGEAQRAAREAAEGNVALEQEMGGTTPPSPAPLQAYPPQPPPAPPPPPPPPPPSDSQTTPP
jgi:Domain of unknown function (DUF4398)